MTQFGFDQADTVSVREVATAIQRLVEDGKYSGGTVLEITANGTRVIPEWGVSPPPTKLTGVSGKEIDQNIGPVIKLLEMEGMRSSLSTSGS